MKQLAYLCVAVFSCLAAIFVYARVAAPRYEAFDLIVVKYAQSPAQVRWHSVVEPVVELDQATRKQAESGLPPSGLLTVVRELQYGKERPGTPHIIFVISHVVSREARLPLPRSGTVVFVQGADDTWRTITGSAVMSERHVIVSKGSVPTDIRIEAENFGGGSVATEVSLEN